MTVRYRPGKEMFLVDALSCLQGPSNQDTIKLDVRIDHHGFTTCRLQQLKAETAKDPELSITYCFTDTLSTDEGLLMKGDRTVILTSNRHRTLENPHVGHQGITAMQSNAKVTVYWPRIDEDIEDLMNRCSSCLLNCQNKAHKSMMGHRIPGGPWQKLGVGFFDHNGQKYMAVVDYFSKFPYLREMKSTNFQHTINHLKKIFSIESSPAILMSDNGPPFNSSEFAQFAQKWNFQHVTSSPNYAQSNGQIECPVQTLRQMLSQCATAKQDLQQALLQLRAIPITSDIPSPAELLHYRPARIVNGQAPTQHIVWDDIRA